MPQLIGNLLNTAAPIGYTGSAGFTGSIGVTGFTGSQGLGFSGYTVISTATTATRFTRYAANTTSGAFTITLPSSPVSGDWIIITDAGDWSVNNLTIARNGSTIEGVADDLIINYEGITVELCFVNSTWQVVATLGAQGVFDPSETLTTLTGATGTVTHNYLTSNVFYHSSISANFTANFTNIPTTNNKSTVMVLILSQGIIAYLPTAVQIDGVSQTIKWINNLTPVGTASKTEIASFTLIRTSSTWTVLGSLNSYG